MPYVIEGQLVIGLDKLRAHRGHSVQVLDDNLPPRGLALYCETCETTIEREHVSTPSLPCGCRNAEDHAEGVALQEQARRVYHIPASTCVGCHIGDDGLSVHSCAIHDRRYWA